MSARTARGAARLAAIVLVLAGGAARAAVHDTRQETALPGAVKDVTIVAERFMFTPDRIEVNQGDRVRITVRSADGTHGFAIKKLGVDTTVPKGGKPVSVEFVADKPGEYAIACSEYCGRGHSHMKAVLVVLPAGGNGDHR